MANFAEIQVVITTNRAIQTEARKWNVRAGEVVFPVMTFDEWKSWLGSRLNGAISCSTVSNLESLRLPALDPEMVALTREMNPDSVTILGKELPVEYREPYYGTPKLPQITLGDEFISTNRWSGLPDEGVKLPGGRVLNVVLKPSTSWSALAEGSDIPVLKQTMKNRLNEEQWTRFDRPVITVPVTIDDTTVLPEIVTAVYGKCTVTDEPLTAFGTLTAYRYWSSDPITWKPEWFRIRTEAETAFSKAQAELEKFKVEAREKREREAIRSEAEAIKTRAKDLYGTYCSYSSEPRIEGDLRDRLYELYYAWIPDTNEECREWTTKARAIIAEVKVAVAEAQQKHDEKLAEEARLLAEGEKQFGGIPEHLLSAFGGNKATTLAFMQKVAKLPTMALDRHLIGCGRDRRRRHLIEVSGDEEFFLGADPNNVSWYVAQVHFDGERHLNPAPVQNSVAVTSPAQPATLDDLAAKWGARRR